MRTDRLKIKWREYKLVLRNEYKHIFSDAGIVLILVFAILIYTTLYSLAYKNEVLRDIPVVVIDQSKTPTSRMLIGAFDAAPNIDVAYSVRNMDEAKNLFFDRKAYGIVYIPQDFEKSVLGGGASKVGVYLDGSYMLYYRQVFTDVAKGVLGTGGQVEVARMMAKGASMEQAVSVADPVSLKTQILYNPYGGYATFIMPTIIIVIIQQTLLIGIGMVGGTWREFGLYKKLITPGEKRLSTLPIVLGKATAYLSIYTVTAGFILTFMYKLFHFPVNGQPLAVIGFLLPYLLACIFMGIALSTLFRRRENSLLFLLWSSIPLLLVSGASLPKEAIPGWLYSIGKIFPSSSGVDGYLRIQIMGASIAEVFTQYSTLWLLAGIYLILACIGIRLVLNKES